MFKGLKLGIAAAVISGLFGIAPANANLLNFNLAWSGASFQNNATAVGTITLDDTVLQNPGSSYGPAATIGITDFSITISGASSGNGTFTLGEFDNFVFETNGGTLDLTQQLVGQPTAIDPWGTPSDGDGGDFNMFNEGLAPIGFDFFTISAAGGEGDLLLLTSFAPVSDVPEPATLGLMGLGLIGVSFAARRRKTA